MNTQHVEGHPQKAVFTCKTIQELHEFSEPYETFQLSLYRVQSQETWDEEW